MTLVDVTGEVRKYSFTPTRKFHKVTEGSLGLAPWAGIPLELVTTAAKEDAILTKIVDPVKPDPSEARSMPSSTYSATCSPYESTQDS